MSSAHLFHSLVTCIRHETLNQRRPGQALSYDKRIIAERFKEFVQHLRLFGVLRHAIHFSLQLLGSDWVMIGILQYL